MTDTTAIETKEKIVHDPEHAPDGDPCAKCGLKTSRHRVRVRGSRKHKRSDASKEKRSAKDAIARELARERRNQDPIVAIDGEGRGRFPHLFTYLSAVDEHGDKRGSVASGEGLSTRACLDFLLDLGVPRVFGFSLGYDFSMMLRDLPDEVLYLLVRPERRSHQLETGRVVHRPIYWRDFKLTYMKRRLGIQRVVYSREKKKYVPTGKGVVVWDVFGFYQGKFTKALADWRTSPAAIIEEIAAMKNRRSDFDKMTEVEVQKYCDTECQLLGKLVRQLIESHETAGLPLESFFGAGSTASVLLTRMHVKEALTDPPDEMKPAVARAFFGGRFELSRVGPVDAPCWNHDISSAYPYELWRLPCLVHGRWRLVTGSTKDVDKAVRGARLALVHCRVKGSGPKCWGPLPFRVPRCLSVAAEYDVTAGSILFPLKSEGTWVWRDEYLAAHDTLWPGVEAVSAWCYQTECDCRPFGELPSIYRERVRIGKEGPGIVLKLGPNSCYGKLAQSMGSSPFRSWILAGCVTSGTRAQILRAIAAARDPANILMVATDGVLARERLTLPQPEDTGTWELPDDKGRTVKKPLGGWEVTGDATTFHPDGTVDAKDIKEPKAVFLARPGIYWPLRATKKELEGIKARGISRSVLAERAAHIEAHFKKAGWRTPYVVDSRCIPCDLPTRWKMVGEGEAKRKSYAKKCEKCGAEPSPPCVRFIGVRQGIDCNPEGRKLLDEGERIGPEHVTRRATFGEWVEWPLEVTFAPAPKRVTVRRDKTLECWERYPGGGMSAPYDKAFPGLEAVLIQDYQTMIEEQPDCDLTLD